MNHRVALIIALLFALSPPLHAADASKPNVLLIITDDQGYGDFSIHGNPHLQTPHIDKLGAESVRFDRFYVNSFCAPTRAALLTGRWPLAHGLPRGHAQREAMRPSEVTIAEALHEGRLSLGLHRQVAQRRAVSVHAAGAGLRSSRSASTTGIGTTTSTRCFCAARSPSRHRATSPTC